MPDADPSDGAAKIEARRRALVDGADIDELRTWVGFEDVADALALEAETPRAEVQRHRIADTALLGRSTARPRPAPT